MKNMARPRKKVLVEETLTDDKLEKYIAFDKFMENIQLIPMEQHLERCRKLKNRADMMGKEDYFLQLKMLEKNMQKG